VTVGRRDVRTLARAWAADDPDERDRAELERLLADGGEAARRDLEDRFAGRLRFGTAGLRGALGGGPNRMNRAVVRATTAALCRWLGEHRPDVGRAGVVVGCDARHRSSELADETTSVLAGAGIPVHRLEDRLPTPLLAFAVRHLGAAAGVMVTASHNPPQDNGYKLYLGDGAQIVPPVDAEIESLIDEVGPLAAVRLGDPAGPLVGHLGARLLDEYVRAVVAATPVARRPPDPLSVVYTPMHGVAGHALAEAMRMAGLPPARVVPAQAEPDPDFPTVAFPNPEEPGALDLAFALARELRADLVLANDPDGDRLAVGVPDGAVAGGWRRLTGDEVGVLLGAFLLDRLAAGPGAATAGGAPLVAASIVSSSMLGKIAAAAGVAFVTTLTGFKWIVRAVDAVPGSRFVFGYEEALGYLVGDVVRDKDGIGAALAVLALAGELRASGSCLPHKLDQLAAAHGVHLTAQHSVATRDPAARMALLRERPPGDVAGERVVRGLDLSAGVVWQEGLPALPPSDVLAYFLASGSRLIVRPSGTEPKLKSYVEVVRPVADGDVAAARATASAELRRLGEGLSDLLG
jgi:phosphomannomutase